MTRPSIALTTLAFALCVFAQSDPETVSSSNFGTGPRPYQIKNLVTFGDSYTDTGYAPGGVAWPDYAAGYGNFSLYPFARAGATCSNELTPKRWPSVFESQIPSFIEKRTSVNGTMREIDQQETMYTLWIGTNDVGVGALLTGDQNPGVSIVDTTACAVNWVRRMYELGARNFLFQNVCCYSLPPTTAKLKKKHISTHTNT